MDPALHAPLRGGRRGRDGPSTQQVAESQRARLAAAMIATVAEHGYERLRIRELEERSGVTKRDIYHHYKGGVHECFMAVFEQIADALIERLVDAWFQCEQPEQRLMLAVTVFAETIASEPAAAWLALCEPFAAGPSAIEAARAAENRLRELLAAGLQAHGIHPAPAAIRAVIAGLGGVARARLFAGRERDLRREAHELARWACCCLAAPQPAEGGIEMLRYAYRPSAALLAKAGRRSESERVRILAATAALAAEHGYAGISERTIRRRAQVTCAEFREQFACEHAAFIGVLDNVWAHALGHATRVGLSGPDWPRGFAQGTAALMGCLAADRFFARIAFADMSSAGGRGGVCAGTRLTSAAAQQFRSSAPEQMRPSMPAAEASTAAGWAIALHQLAQGERRTLAGAAPTIAFIGLAPAIGAEQAAEATGAILPTATRRALRTSA